MSRDEFMAPEQEQADLAPPLGNLRLWTGVLAGPLAWAARLRFRPILMTSFAFILGVVPLVFATGAGAASRQALGTVVFGGMISSTLLAVFFVPIFYVVMQGIADFGRRTPKHPPSAETPTPTHAADSHRA